MAATLGALLSLAGVLTYVLWPSAGDSVPRLTNPVQVTSAAGVEDFPTWSPDGGRLAFQSDQSGNDDIWVVQLGGGAPVNLTADRPEQDHYPSWSPDGSQIAFESGGEIFVMSAVGGAARKVLAPEDALLVRKPQWSADGTELAASTDRRFIEIVSLRTEESRRLQFPPSPADALRRGLRARRCTETSWSPDGRYFACLDAGNRNWEVSHLWLLPISGAEPIWITEDLTKTWSPTWSADGRYLFFVSNRGGSMDLWRQRIDEDGRPQGAPEPVTNGVGIRTASLSADGTKLAYSRGGRVGNVWRMPILKERPATWDDAEQITSDRAQITFLDLSPDGRTLLVSSDRAGPQNLWKLPSEGGEMTQITVGTAPDLAPDWSPDGTEIVFTSWRGGGRGLFVIPAGGGPARPLAPHPSDDHFPAWSPDGREIAFSSLRSGNSDVWVVSAEGGEPRQVTDDPALDYRPLWSPDGRWLVFESWRMGSMQQWRVPGVGGEAEPLTQQRAEGAHWSPDGSQLYFASKEAEPPPGLWSLSMIDGTEVPLTDLTGRAGQVGTYSLGTDGEYLYFTWQEDLGDIWVMDVVQE